MSNDATIDLALRVLELLDRGSFVATYKYAVLLGLIDLCLEEAEKSGGDTDMVTTRQLAMKVVELYWPHTVEFPARGLVLQQGGPAILGAIRRFRAEHAPTPSAGRWASQRAAPVQYARLLDQVELTLIEMPLPKLQRIGSGAPSPFLYTISWTDGGLDAVRRGAVRRYQAGHTEAFDNRIHLQPGVSSALVRLNGLLRPILMREWAAMVAKLNELEESKLEQFLFGVERERLKPVRAGLRDLQKDLCFYCNDPLAGTPDVDHFIAWSRVRDDAIENLVLSHKRCNGQKSDHLAAIRHLRRWRQRMDSTAGQGKELAAIAEQAGWESRPEETIGITRSVYLNVPDKAKLWSRAFEFEDTNLADIRRALQA